MESIAAVVCDDKAATSARRAVVAPASDRVRDYWIGARRAMAGSLFTASGLFYLSAWWDSGLTQAPPNPTGIVRMLPLYAEVGGTFGLGALAILCALLLPLYLGFTGRGMIRGVESNDHLQEALAVQEVREHLILYLSFGGAVTGWLLLPVAASSVALALPIVVVVGVLCCLVALREETAAQGLMRHARAQQARKGLLSLLSNLGVAAGEPKPPAESDRRRARRWETAAQVAWVIPTFLVLWLPLRRGDPASAWWMAAVLASFFLPHHVFSK